MNSKIVSLGEVIQDTKFNIKKSKTVGLVLGGFDILHMGHINLFRLAKKYVNILIVGLDNDETLKNTKGEKRPINNYKKRSEFLSELSLVDKVFKINGIYTNGDEKSFQVVLDLYKRIRPTHVFTSIKCDNLWKEKRNLAKTLGIKFIPEKSSVTHTSDILKLIESEL